MKTKILVIVGLLFMSNYTFASHIAWTSTEIKTIIVHDNGTPDFMGEAHVVMMSTDTSRPSCASPTDRFIIDLSKPLSKIQYSTVLSAYMANKPITVYFNDFCTGTTAAIRNVIVGTPD